jgi:hypothetical protein
MDRVTHLSQRRTTNWFEISTNTNLDRRHRNWLLAEEVGDVVFVAARGVVLVHPERAEHIVRELGGAVQQPVAWASPPTEPRAPGAPPGGPTKRY